MENRFEDFLMEKHAEQYIGYKDNMVDDFDKWLCNLDPDQWLNYGEWFGNKLEADALKKRIEELETNLIPPKNE